MRAFHRLVKFIACCKIRERERNLIKPSSIVIYSRSMCIYHLEYDKHAHHHHSSVCSWRTIHPYARGINGDDIYQLKLSELVNNC